MERALRTLTYKSSVPLTPRRNGNDSYAAEKCVSSNSASRRIEERSDNRSSSEEAVRVAIRVRPLAPGGDQCAERAWRISPEQNAIVEIRGAQTDQSFTTPSRTRRGSGDAEYVYDNVFGEDANTCEIYDALVRDLVESVTEEGISATVFTYGQTCSGKTFTMQGCDSHKGSVGIIHLAANDIFQTIKDDDSNSEYSVRVSYVEIYNEELRDLLSDNNRKSSTSLIIREDKTGSIAVDGLREVAVKNLDQLIEVFRFGEKNKSVGSTKMNDRSSRSHAILKIVFEKRTVVNPKLAAVDKENFADLNSPSNDLVVKTTSVLNLVDLAGSESVRHTGASGMQKKEGGMINQR
jgi:centromeric protein E